MVDWIGRWLACGVEEDATKKKVDEGGLDDGKSGGCRLLCVVRQEVRQEVRQR